MELVSVVIPAWNVASPPKLKWFHQAIESIVYQDYVGPIEIVLVDDGSTDQTPHAYLALRQKHHSFSRRLGYYRMPHSGITRALNHGLGRANSEFIARLDADDWSKPSRFTKQVHYLNEHPEVALLGTPVHIIRGERATKEIWNTLTTHEQLVKGLRERNQLAHSSVMFRRCVLDIVGGYDEHYPYAQDWDYWWRIAQKYRIAQLAEPLTYLRLHDKSVSSDGRAHQQNQCALQIKRKINQANTGAMT
jgi:glycosyltransferase involved in cell wall biosynthesis